MKRYVAIPGIILAAVLGWAPLPAQQHATTAAARYFPPKGSWTARSPAELGFNPAKLAAAIQFSIQNQNPNTRNLAEDILNTFRNETPYNKLIGPAQERTGMNGVIIRHGYVAAEWGDTKRADMTFSVTKSFLSTVVGLAYTRGLIKNLKGPVANDMPQEWTFSLPSTIERSPGSISCVRPVTGPELFGTNRTGPTARPRGRNPSSGPTARCMTRARSINTTTHG